MRKSIAFTTLIGASVLLSACGSSGLLSRDRPDEFAVQRQAPLVVPPDFSLTPPQPGAPRPADQTAQQQAQEIIAGKKPKDAAAAKLAAEAVGKALADFLNAFED